MRNKEKKGKETRKETKRDIKRRKEKIRTEKTYDGILKMKLSIQVLQSGSSFHMNTFI